MATKESAKNVEKWTIGCLSTSTRRTLLEPETTVGRDLDCRGSMYEVGTQAVAYCRHRRGDVGNRYVYAASLYNVE